MRTEASQPEMADSQFAAADGPDGVDAAARIIDVGRAASGKALIVSPLVGMGIQFLVLDTQPADRLGLNVDKAPQHPHIQTLEVVVPSGIMDLTASRPATCRPLDAHVAVGCMRAKVSVITDGRSATGHSVQVDLSQGPLVMVYVHKGKRFSTHAAPAMERISVWVPLGTFG